MYSKITFIYNCLLADVADLDLQEKRLDELTRNASLQLKMLTEDPGNKRYPLTFSRMFTAIMKISEPLT